MNKKKEMAEAKTQQELFQQFARNYTLEHITYHFPELSPDYIRNMFQYYNYVLLVDALENDSLTHTYEMIGLKGLVLKPILEPLNPSAVESVLQNIRANIYSKEEIELMIQSYLQTHHDKSTINSKITPAEQTQQLKKLKYQLLDAKRQLDIANTNFSQLLDTSEIIHIPFKIILLLRRYVVFYKGDLLLRYRLNETVRKLLVEQHIIKFEQYKWVIIDFKKFVEKLIHWEQSDTDYKHPNKEPYVAVDDFSIPRLTNKVESLTNQLRALEKARTVQPQSTTNLNTKTDITLRKRELQKKLITYLIGEGYTVIGDFEIDQQIIVDVIAYKKSSVLIVNVHAAKHLYTKDNWQSLLPHCNYFAFYLDRYGYYLKNEIGENTGLYLTDKAGNVEAFIKGKIHNNSDHAPIIARINNELSKRCLTLIGIN